MARDRRWLLRRVETAGRAQTVERARRAGEHRRGGLAGAAKAVDRPLAMRPAGCTGAAAVADVGEELAKPPPLQPGKRDAPAHRRPAYTFARHTPSPHPPSRRRRRRGSQPQQRRRRRPGLRRAGAPELWVWGMPAPGRPEEETDRGARAGVKLPLPLGHQSTPAAARMRLGRIRRNAWRGATAEMAAGSFSLYVPPKPPGTHRRDGRVSEPERHHRKIPVRPSPGEEENVAACQHGISVPCSPDCYGDARWSRGTSRVLPAGYKLNAALWRLAWHRAQPRQR